MGALGYTIKLKVVDFQQQITLCFLSVVSYLCKFFFFFWAAVIKSKFCMKVNIELEMGDSVNVTLRFEKSSVPKRNTNPSNCGYIKMK